MENISLEKLRSYWSQLLDLKAGYLKEIVIKKENCDELIGIIRAAIKTEEEFIEMDKHHSEEEKAEELRQKNL